MWLSGLRMSQTEGWLKSPKLLVYLASRRDSDEAHVGRQRERARVAGDEIRGSGGLDHVGPPKHRKGSAFHS